MASASSAAPKPSESQLRAQLKELNKRVDRLIVDYNAKRVELAKAQKSSEAAQKRLTKATADYDAAQKHVAALADLRYQTTTDFSMIVPPDLGAASVAAQLEQEQAALLSGFDGIRQERKSAADAAATLIKDIKAQSGDVVKRRKAAEGLIDEITDKLNDLIPIAPGKLSSGSWAPELPSGSDNITPRTRLMKAEVEKNFNLRFPVGCYRSGGNGEHPLGRACDFMMSSGGSMPTTDMQALGDNVAEWAIKNGGKLGVKYVIWKQRIYNLGSPGWRGMSDRGGITANHFDHVHISMN